MYAVVGVLRSATVDGPQAVACVKSGFATEEEAYQFAAAYVSTDERRTAYGDLYLQSYEGYDWKPAGGRCFYYARTTLVEQYDRLLSFCGMSEVPRVAIGECNCGTPEGQRVRGKHAWIEAGDFVIDCGSYLRQFKRETREAFYESNEPTNVVLQKREELRAAQKEEME